MAPKLLGIVVVAVIFGLALPRIASYGDVLDVVRSLTWGWIGVLAVAVVLNVATFAPPWATALPGLGVFRALVLTQAATATASVVPGGEAVGLGLSLAMLRAWGFERAKVAAAAAVLTALNVLAKVVLPAAALVALLATGGAGGLLAVLVAVGVTLVAALLVAIVLALRSEDSTRRFGERLNPAAERLMRLIRRPAAAQYGERLVGFRREAIDVVREHWAALVVWTLVGHLTVFLVLLATVRAVGISAAEVGTVGVFAAWALTRLMTAIPLTPGGLGIIELGLTGALVAAGGDHDRVVAAVLLYRVLTWLPSILLGGPAALLWKRLGGSGRVPGAKLDPAAMISAPDRRTPGR